MVDGYLVLRYGSRSWPRHPPPSPYSFSTRRFSAEDQEALAEEASTSAPTNASTTTDPSAAAGPAAAPAAGAGAVLGPQAAGGPCLGTTWLDEVAIGLAGENAWGGTLPHPRAPGRIPGGSSGGSGSTVARSEADLACGTGHRRLDPSPRQLELPPGSAAQPRRRPHQWGWAAGPQPRHGEPVRLLPRDVTAGYGHAAGADRFARSSHPVHSGSRCHRCHRFHGSGSSS